MDRAPVVTQIREGFRRRGQAGALCVVSGGDAGVSLPPRRNAICSRWPSRAVMVAM